jgi:hypothetical protein
VGVPHRTQYKGYYNKSSRYSTTSC